MARESWITQDTGWPDLRIALGSDEKSHVTGLVELEIRDRGHQIQLFGPLADPPEGGVEWPEVAESVAEAVASGRADEGILFCWTGTGVCMTANKVPGVRAALCGDAETARGARAYNQANVLCLSLRLASEPVVREILDAWFSTGADPSEEENVSKSQQPGHALQSGSCAALFSLTLRERNTSWQKKSSSVSAGVAAGAEDAAGPKGTTDSRPRDHNRSSRARR